MKEKRIRPAARVVVWDEKRKKIAVLQVKDGLYHKIPGGGVEEQEGFEKAALREVVEEAASDVEFICRLGENKSLVPGKEDLIDHSVCFLAKKINEHPAPLFTQKERENKFNLLWLIFE